MRQPFLDVLRGLAVMLMIYTHALLCWTAPGARSGAAWTVSSLLFAMPSRLFLLLLGGALALRLHVQADRQPGRRAVRRGALLRGAELVALGLALRLHDYWANGMNTSVRLWKVDILNCMGLSTALIGLLCLDRDGRPAPRRALLLLGVTAAVAPLAAQLPYPSWAPAPLLAYLYGQRPLAYFPQLPWLIYALLGLLLGHAWRRVPAERRGRTMALAAALASAVVLLAFLLRRFMPTPPPAVLLAEADPVLMAGTAAAAVLFAALTYAASSLRPQLARPGTAIVLLGQASLPIYFVHLTLVYGWIAFWFRERLALGAAALGSLAVTVAMVPLSQAWLGLRGLRARWAARRAPGSA